MNKDIYTIETYHPKTGSHEYRCTMDENGKLQMIPKSEKDYWDHVKELREINSTQSAKTELKFAAKLLKKLKAFFRILG